MTIQIVQYSLAIILFMTFVFDYFLEYQPRLLLKTFNRKTINIIDTIFSFNKGLILGFTMILLFFGTLTFN